MTNRARLPEPVIEGGPYGVPTYRQWNRQRRLQARARGKRADRVARAKGPLADALWRLLMRPPLFPRLLYRVESVPPLLDEGP